MEIGKTNQLYIARQTDNGFYLQDEEDNEVLLPNAYITEDMQIDNVVEVFVYRDSEERLVATTEKPIAEVGNFAFLVAKQVNELGAFMDWGLVKDLFVPHAEQIEKIHEGQSYLVFIFVDEQTDRLLGSTRLKDFVFYDDIDVKEGDEVDLVLYRKTDLGMNAIVNNLYMGLIFESDIHKKINVGDRIKGYVKKVREDGKLDLLLDPIGYKNSIGITKDAVLNYLIENGGILHLTDKSSPEEINQILGLSKKAFKRSIGALYKQKNILIKNDSIELIK